jgi:MFS family permease
MSAIATAEQPPALPDSIGWWPTLRLAGLFGTLYFIQGVCEPTAGLISQPTQALLERWGYNLAQITGFFAVLAFPWTIKPLFGWISDYWPIRGSRRRSYLMLTTVLAMLGFLAVARMPIERYSMFAALLAMMLLPAVAIAFFDVVVDGLMVETAQPRGLTGRLQAIQWTALYGSQIVMGTVGGWIAAHGQQRLGMAICCLFAAVGLSLTILFVREAPRDAPPAGFGEALRQFLSALRSPLVLGVGGFLFLWHFNPFSSVILQNHMTDVMGLGQQFYGDMQSVNAVAAVVASLTYWLYCRRVPLRWLLHLSIAFGIASTLAYWWMINKSSAIVVTIAVGFTYQTAMLVQLDLAARVVPIQSASTVFALLMSLSNLGTDLSRAAGGLIYEGLNARLGPTGAFNGLVGVGALFTAACWLLVPMLRRVMAAHRR